MPSFLSSPKSVGGGKWASLFAKIPIPKSMTGEKTNKSLSEMLYGTDSERKAIPHTTDSLQNKDNTPFGQIDEVETPSTTSNKLRGRLYRVRHDVAAKHPTRQNLCVLFCSGSGGSAEEYGEPIAEYYLSQGVRLLAMNYRGFGGSSGSFPSESGLYDDAYAMYNFLVTQKQIAPGDIIVHGYSLGGPIAASLVKTLAKKTTLVRALVLHSPMVSSYEAAADAAQEAKDGQAATVTKLFLGEFDTRDKLKTLHGKAPGLPIRLISGTKTAGDALDIAHCLCNPANATSFLQDVTAMHFGNLQSARGNSDHTTVTPHMNAAHGILQTIM